MKLSSRLLRIVLLLLAPFELIPHFRQWLRYRIALHDLYKPRPDDIFIVTYPKSGTTLMQMMLYQLTTDGSMDIPHIGSVSPWFETELMTVRNAAVGKAFEALPSPRFFKSHFGREALPRQGRFIYVVRGVRDVLDSAYNHQNLMTGRDHDRVDFVSWLLRAHNPQLSWFANLESWRPHRKDDNVLFLTFEEIVRDLEGTVRKVAAFCGIAIDESSMPRILERCSVGFMKQHWDKFDPRLRRLSRTPTEFIRRGVPGTGRRELTPEQEEIVSRRLKELATKLNVSAGEPHGELFSEGAGGRGASYLTYPFTSTTACTVPLPPTKGRMSKVPFAARGMVKAPLRV